MSGELFPANVSRLEALGVAFTWRKQEHDIKVECPTCGHAMILHEDKPFHYCGWPTCSAWHQSFDEILTALSIDQAIKKRGGMESGRKSLSKVMAGIESARRESEVRS